MFMKIFLAKKIIFLAITLAIVIPVYGLISWNIFGKPTFLSAGANCMPPTPDLISDQLKSIETPHNSIFREGSMFGEYCATN